MIKIKRILGPTDLSPQSTNAMRYAIALARAHDAELVFLYCDARPFVARDHNGELKSLLFDRRGESMLAGVRWRFVIAISDDAGEEIAHQAQLESADLIVMRSRRRPHRAALLGSTAESVCRTAPCPVLVMHNDEPEAVNSDLEIGMKRVLVAFDFSDYAELALAYGLSLAQEHQAELHLLHVLPPRSLSEPEIAWYPNKSESVYHTAAKRLQKVVPAEVHLWCEVKNIVSEGHPYREILNYAESNSIDLICLGAHGVGFDMRALFGSNVDRVLRQSPCPVLVARPMKPISIPAGNQRNEDHKRLLSL